MELFLTNSLTRQKEQFKPLQANTVGVYTCGPTVYSYVTIGNWRTYTLADVLVRTLEYMGYPVEYVMNITDVGHLTGDNEGDASTGDDRLEKAARKEGRDAWSIAKFYEEDFLLGLVDLHFRKPNVLPRATDHIAEQIELITQIEARGLTYHIDDGIYFDVQKYESLGNQYGELSTLDQIKVGARVEFNTQKKDDRDFALWKFSPKDVKRDMEWDSPWGMGFPGWHIECSAMSMKYLGKQFDIHLGGEDLRSTHHPNEIVQSESVSGIRPFVTYWMHGAFLTVDGGRMGKSLGNAYTLADIKDHGFDVGALRYFYFTGHWRQQLNFSWDNLKAAKQAHDRLVARFWKLTTHHEGEIDLERKAIWQESFEKALGNDLSMPEVLSCVWRLLQAEESLALQYSLLCDWDRVLGFNLVTCVSEAPEDVRMLVMQRQSLREQKQWLAADVIRDQIKNLGWVIEDTIEGAFVRKK